MFATAHIIYNNPWTAQKIAKDLRLDLMDVAAEGLTVVEYIQKMLAIPYEWYVDDMTIHTEDPRTEIDNAV